MLEKTTNYDLCSCFWPKCHRSNIKNSAQVLRDHYDISRCSFHQNLNTEYLGLIWALTAPLKVDRIRLWAHFEILFAVFILTVHKPSDWGQSPQKVLLVISLDYYSSKYCSGEQQDAYLDKPCLRLADISLITDDKHLMVTMVPLLHDLSAFLLWIKRWANPHWFILFLVSVFSFLLSLVYFCSVFD